MLKYKETMITFREVPDEISLCINLTNCPHKCKGCHSPELRENIGFNLTQENLTKLIENSRGITCVCFMGGDANKNDVVDAIKFIKKHYPELKTCIYSGDNDPYDSYSCSDYVKFGSYQEEFGPLDKKTTNQKMWMFNNEYDGHGVFGRHWEDITYKFWKHEN